MKLGQHEVCTTGEREETYLTKECIAESLRQQARWQESTIVRVLTGLGGSTIPIEELVQSGGLCRYVITPESAQYLTGADEDEPEQRPFSPEYLENIQRFYSSLDAGLLRCAFGSVEIAASDVHATVSSESAMSKEETALPPLSQVVDELLADVPESVWDRIPPDLSRNFDHYLYGAPREDE